MVNRSPERTQLYVDILTTAIEGGINYWGAVSEYKWENREPADVYAVVHDQEDDDDNAYRIDIEVIAKGFNALDKQSREGLIKNTYMNDFFRDVRQGDWDNVDFDADIADLILQTGIFGKVVYG